MNRIIKYWILLKIHNIGLCKPFHWKKDDDIHFKGWCPTLEESIRTIESRN